MSELRANLGLPNHKIFIQEICVYEESRMFALEGLGFLDMGDFGFCEARQPGPHHLKMNTAPCWGEVTLLPEELHLRVKNHH